MENFVQSLIDIVHTLGLPGIFIASLVESTFIPVPIEITMIPAGILVGQGKMDYLDVWLVSTAGMFAGSFINYWIGFHYGRKVFEKYGKYFFMGPGMLEKLEHFYVNHGSISTFLGRLIPGIRHYIPFPAGLAKMNIKKFAIYTALGGGLWLLVILHLGYYVGKNSVDDPAAMLMKLKIVAISVVVVITVGYIAGKRMLNKE